MAGRPQNLVFSLFGEYLLDRPGPIWVGSLIDLLAPFGLSENAVRTALSRMARRGWLTTERRGRLSFYDLDPRGRRLLEEGASRIHHPPRDAAWDGVWTLVTYSIPEERRERRDEFRTRLTWLGFGSLGGGLWVSPHPVMEPVAEAARDLGIADQVEVFRAFLAGTDGVERIVERCWDLEEVERRYRTFLRRFEPEFEASRQALRGGSLLPEDAFVRRFELIHEYRGFPLVDPYLPRALLPARWVGDRAAPLFERYRELLAGPADRWVDAVLAAGPATVFV